MRYDAFISYSRSADVGLGPALRTGMQSLGKPWNKRRALSVFLDQSSLEATANLKTSLEEDLDAAEFLVLLACPDSATSEWVGREIAHWVQTRGSGERIRLVLTAGEIEWDDDAGDFEWERSSAVNPALRGVFSEEPLWIDMCWARQDPALSVRANLRFADAVATLVAPMHQLSKEELVGADLTQYRKAQRLRRAAIAGLTVLTVLAIVVGIVAVLNAVRADRNAREAATQQSIAEANAAEADAQRVEAERQRERAVQGEQEARDQARKAVADSLATRALVEGDERPDKAMALALASSRLDPTGSGEAVLLRLVAGASATDRFFRIDAEPTAVALSPAGDRFAIGDADGGIRMGSFELGPASRFTDLGSTVIGVGFSGPDRLVAGLADGRIVEFELGPDGIPSEASLATVPAIDSWAFDPRLGRIAVLGDDGSDRVLTLLESGPDGVVARARRTEFEGWPAAVAFDAGGQRLGVAALFGVGVLDASTLEDLGPSVATSVELVSIALQDDRLVAAGTPPGSNIRDGLIAGYGDDGQELGFISLEQSVNVLTACGDRVLFGTAAGEYGWVGDPVPTTRNIGDIVERIRSVACADSGGFVVVGDRGLVHLRTTESLLSANEFPARAPDDMPELWDERFGMSLGGDLGGLRTGAGDPLPVSDRYEILPTLLAGESPLDSNCASLAPNELGTVGADSDNRLTELLATCGPKQIWAGPAISALEIRDDSDPIELGSSSLIPYALAWSADGRRVFVGGGLEGSLYRLEDQGPPEEILRLRTPAFFTAASFAANGHVLITTVHYPPEYVWAATLHIIGGNPLQRLACHLSYSSLDDTVAIELLSEFDASALGCDAVAGET